MFQTIQKIVRATKITDNERYLPTSEKGVKWMVKIPRSKKKATRFFSQEHW